MLNVDIKISLKVFFIHNLLRYLPRNLDEAHPQFSLEHPNFLLGVSNIVI